MRDVYVGPWVDEKAAITYALRHDDEALLHRHPYSEPCRDHEHMRLVKGEKK